MDVAKYVGNGVLVIRAFAIAGLFFASSILASAANRSQNPAACAPQAQNSAPAAPQATAADAPKPKRKKVWTNENLADAGGTISVVGNPQSTSKLEPKRTANKSVDPKFVASLRDQLQKLESQLAVVDQQLSDLKDLNKGESKRTGGVRQDTWHYDSSSVEEQIRRLQDMKTKIQASIEAILDEARKRDIDPGQLR